jgi:hypothetical protein
VFEFNRTGRYAIVDRSGYSPDQSDDGRLWLNFNEPILLGGHETVVPVKNSGGSPYGVFVDPPTAIALSERFDWALNVRGIPFKVVRDNER